LTFCFEGYLGKAKVFASCSHCRVEILPKIFIAIILWKIELVEARVGARKAILATIVAVNVKAAKPVHTLKLLEAIERNLASACDELKEFGTLLFVKGADCTPEPLDLGR
jgi:hypothetical protein